MKAAEKEQARQLRAAGYSIKDIGDLLRVARSSVSCWVRDIQLSPEQVAGLNRRIAASRQKFSYLSRCHGANTNRVDAEKRHGRFRQAGYERARADERFRLLCALYWGEGRKTKKLFGVSNSDPELLKGILGWLIRSGYDDAIGFYVRYHTGNGVSETDVRSWWLQQLPMLKEKHLRKFSVCGVHRASQAKKVGKLPYGTAAIVVCRTELYFNVLGGINYLKEHLGDW